MKPIIKKQRLSGLPLNRNSEEGSWQLYDTPQKLNVETFYAIMKTGNLDLLIEKQEKLNEAQRKKLTEILNDAWLDLQEFYYSNTNDQSYKRFKGNFRNLILIQNEITGCYAGLRLVELGDSRGYEFLQKFGIRQTDEKDINSAIRRRETKLEFAKNKLDGGGKKEAVSFFKIVASVEKGLNRQLNLVEINLERWVAYLSQLKEKHEAEKKDKHKSKRKWQGN